MSINIYNSAKGIIYLMAIAVLAVCGILLPELAREEAVGKINPPSPLPYLIAAWIIASPIFIAFHQIIKLINNANKNRAFSTESLTILKNIRICANIFSLLIVLFVVITTIVGRNINPHEDLTPLFTIGIVMTATSSVIATFLSILKGLLENAVTMKNENDFTI